MADDRSRGTVVLFSPDRMGSDEARFGLDEHPLGGLDPPLRSHRHLRLLLWLLKAIPEVWATFDHDGHGGDSGLIRQGQALLSAVVVEVRVRRDDRDPI